MLIVKLGVLSANGIMCGGHKETRKFKAKHLRDLLRNFKAISLVRKPKYFLKRRANISKLAGCQPVITPASIGYSKLTLKELKQGVKYPQS